MNAASTSKSLSRFCWIVCLCFVATACSSETENEGEKSPNVQTIDSSLNAVDTIAEVVEPEIEVPVLPPHVPFVQEAVNTVPLQLLPHQIELASGDTFALSVPENWTVRVAAEGLDRIRFLALSPDGRLFATDRKNRGDNERGKVLIFENFNPATAQFDTVITYLSGLRNPNHVKFYTDTLGQDWLYLTLTDRLVRYPYNSGDVSPTSEEETLATYPDYGLSYKYGGWHLTRSIAINKHKIYVSVGSSCNVCEEKEKVRASIIEMNMDGSDAHHYAYGVRNAVGMLWNDNHLFTTNMGADHLGDDTPEEGLYEIQNGAHYGWPYYYETEGQIYADTSFVWTHDSVVAEQVPLAFSGLGAHSAPLGLCYFENGPPELEHYFLVALHGSGYVRIGNGYNVVRTAKGQTPEPILTGFLQDGHRFGRPCDVFPYGDKGIFVTDDHGGVLYYLEYGVEEEAELSN